MASEIKVDTVAEKTSANGVTVSEDGSDSEGGFGLGFRPNEKVTVMFDVFEDTNLFTVQYNF